MTPLPGEADRLLRQAFALRASGLLEEAREAARSVLRIHAGQPAALHLLGLIALDSGRHGDAIALLARAMRVSPQSAPLHRDLARALRAAERWKEAAEILEAALAMEPGNLDDSLALAWAYQNLARSGDALDIYSRAAARGQRSRSLNADASVALIAQGRIEEGIESARQAFALEKRPADFSMAVQPMHYVSEIEPQAIFEEHRRFARIFETPLASQRTPHANSRDPERRLRIGYLSPAFRAHPVARFLRPLVSAHNSLEVEVFYYSAIEPGDPATLEWRERAGPNWRDIHALSDGQAAAAVRADAIDILVDLCGHDPNNRLLLFALKPAPVQFTWLGYPDTTGLRSIDYRITDAFADPPGLTERFHSEELVRLPGCFLCFEPPPYAPEPGPLPLRTNGYVTFGSFNNFAKLSRAAIELWARILLAVDGSRLVLKYAGGADTAAKQRIEDAFARQGVAPGRVDVQALMWSRHFHLRAYHGIDICLDPFPYNGTTTSCESLWMGVPFVTLAGRAHVGRVGVSLLSQLGLTDWIATSREDYLARAVHFARSPDLVESVHGRLRDVMKSSDLTAAPAFAGKMERAYREAWRRWCVAG